MGEYHQTKYLSVPWWLPKSLFFVADFSSVVFILKNFLDLVHAKTYVAEVSGTFNFVSIKAELISTIVLLYVYNV